MALLIQIKQRIKAIETIKKITHAMRLIAMSHHSQLKGKEETLKSYADGIRSLFYTIKVQAPDWHSSVLYPAVSTHPKTLIIVVGSQKGLCGNFNSQVFKLLGNFIQQHTAHQMSVIAIGKKAVDFVKDYQISHAINVVELYENFSVTSLTTIAQAITSHIFGGVEYHQVLIISNKQKTFFVQKAHIIPLIPFAQQEQHDVAATQSYIWEQSPADVLEVLAHQYVQATLEMMLFQSLLAEQAARFLSMDASTRNAQTLLETTELYYNKLRQAKITKELTELTGSSL